MKSWFLSEQLLFCFAVKKTHGEITGRDDETSSLKPAATKPWLIALAGLTWSVVGILLCRLAYGWSAFVNGGGFASLELVSILMAIVAYRFCFSKIARKNITRLSLLTEKTCIFAFQRWKSYVLIGVMVTLGITLRHLPIPRP